MPRSKSDDKRAAILTAATHLIVKQGLSAPTMKIAKEAGIPNGSLFTYFTTKTDLINQLYLELKTEMATAALQGTQTDTYAREDFFRVWQNWTSWAVAFPEKHKAVTQLNVSEDITSETRKAVHQAMSPLAKVLEDCRSGGPMGKVPIAFLSMVVNSVAEGTMEFMRQDPKNARKHCNAGFEAVWRMVH